MKQTTREIIQQELEDQAHKKMLRKFKWDEHIEPVAKRIEQELLAERPFLTPQQAWDLAVEKSKLEYKKKRKAERLGIIFK